MLSYIKSRISDVLSPITDFIAKMGIRPNHLTVIGFLFGVASAYLIFRGDLMISAVFLILSGIMDVLDGALARNKGLITKFGGFLDSVLDRYVDIAVFIALGFYVGWTLSLLALSGALMVSYTRARAEKEIERCDVGIAERGERIAIIVFGLIFSDLLYYAVLTVAILSHITAVHRIIHTYRIIRKG